MKRIDYLLISLLMFTWVAEDLYHLAPRSVKIYPFPFSDEGLSFRWYIYEVINYIKLIIFVVCIAAKRSKVYWITQDIIKITIGLIGFSFIWFVLMYNNPFYSEEWWIKFVSILLIYVSIKAIRYHAKHNNSIFRRRGVHRDD